MIDASRANAASSQDVVPPALEVRELRVRFGGVTAVDGIGVAVRPGAIVGLIGPNGAGKTTLFDAICGYVDATGSVLVGGERIDGLPPYQRARRGLGRSFQDCRLFPSLVVRDALGVAVQGQSPWVGLVSAAVGLGIARRAERIVRERVDQLIEIFALASYADKFVSELSTGTRRVVDLAAMLALEPSVLLLDEPSSGIAQKETEALTPLILRMRDDLACTILVIEHDMPLVTSVADELIALELGHVIAKGAPKQVVNDPVVVTSYLGGDVRAIQRSGLARQAKGRSTVGRTRKSHATEAPM